MALLRRNYTCFYCNQKTDQPRKKGLRSFECNKCQAVNFLDEVYPYP